MERHWIFHQRLRRRLLEYADGDHTRPGSHETSDAHSTAESETQRIQQAKRQEQGQEATHGSWTIIMVNWIDDEILLRQTAVSWEQV